jgi:DNA-binding NarL/FixJ family response regulator
MSRGDSGISPDGDVLRKRPWMKLRVLIVDDHDVLRVGVRALIDQIDGADVVGEACDGRTAVDQARSLLPDVVLMDIVMPELNGIDAGRQILAQGTGIKLIALSARHDRHIVTATLGKALAIPDVVAVGF